MYSGILLTSPVRHPASLLSPFLVAAALGCGEDATAPTPQQPAPALATTTSPPLFFRQVSAGDFHTCGVTTDNHAYCWGDNHYGQLGDGTTTDRSRPVAVLRGLQFLAVSSGQTHTCGLTTNNRVFCWGNNESGQLGNTGVRRKYPVLVLGGHRFHQLDVGFRTTCAITLTDFAFCWGDNRWGQLGDGTKTNRSSPVPVAGGHRFRQLSTGAHSCGVTTSDRAYCWGNNDVGQLGIGQASNSPTTLGLKPVAVAGGLSFRQVTAGTGGHSCGVTPNHKAFCWGSNDDGQLGDGTTTRRMTPGAVTGGLEFVAVGSGPGYTCGLTTGNRAYCWGDNFVGKLGDGAQSPHLTPVAVVGGLQFSRVSNGGYHTCGVTTRNKRAYCWGHNGEGQLGDGTPKPDDGSIAHSTTPVPVAGPM